MHFIVGIGASAGGLDALEKFFKNMPLENDMSFIVVQHLSPDYKSLMGELLAKFTDMPIKKVEDGMSVEGGCIYLIPPKKNMTIIEKTLYLSDIDQSRGLNLPIDIFFRSLAEDQGETAIGIVLSGTGSDGTNGIRAIKESGGMIMAQDEFSAQFDGMPKSAIFTGLVDYVLPAEEMGIKLIEYISRRSKFVVDKSEIFENKSDDAINKIFTLMRNIIGLDLTHYKQSTVLRRIERRMSIHQIQNLESYYIFLRQSKNEVKTLCGEVLIGVTKFFRDTEAFEIILDKVIPEIFNNKQENELIRVWVAGCSTGEEAYSIAILIQEYITKSGRKNEVKIFATDFDKDAIEFAGAGMYPASIAADVSSEILKKYFVYHGEYYMVSRQIREMLIFASHNLIQDPPFNKMDLISCRNLMIYFQPVLQKKVLSYFHYSLNSNGILFLGSSETTGEMSMHFAPIDNKWKIYRHKGEGRIVADSLDILQNGLGTESKLHRFTTSFRVGNSTKVLEQLYKVLIKNYIDPSIVIDENYDIILICGGANRYLKVPEGHPSLNIMNMLPKETAIPLAAALRKAFKDNKEIRFQSYGTKDKKESESFDVVVSLIPKELIQQRIAVIVFKEIKEAKIEVNEIYNLEIDNNASERIKVIEQELQYTRENLQATIEELETSNEELQATNEELLSSNEELQSTNEELQSVNEELITVNSEYQMKIVELTELNNDMDNLLSSTHIGTVFLDRDLNIRKFTPAVTKVINLMEQDIGRPISHISHNLVGADLVENSKHVLQTLIPVEKEVQRLDGEVFLKGIHPYRTRDNMIKGIVITFVNITEIKKATDEILKLSYAVEQSPAMILITDLKGNIQYANKKFFEQCGYRREEVIGNNARILRSGVTDESVYKDLWKTITNGKKWTGEFCNKKKNGERFWEMASISPIKVGNGGYSSFIKISEDITDKKIKEEEIIFGQLAMTTLIEYIPYAVTLVNLKGRIVYANHKAEELFILDRKEITSRSYNSQEWGITDEDGNRIKSKDMPFSIVIKTGEPIKEYVYRIKQSDKKDILVSTDAVPIKTNDGSIIGVYITYYGR